MELRIADCRLRNRKIQWYILAGFALLLSLLTGCFFDELSWSPDGRYLAYAAGDRGAIWRWDSRTFKTEKIEIRESDGWQGNVTINERVKSCRYLPGDHILFLTEVDKEVGDLYLADLKGKRCQRIAQKTGFSFDIAPNGRIFFCARDKATSDTARLYEYSGGLEGTSRTILDDAEKVSFLRLDPDGKRLAYIKDENALMIMDLDKGTTRTLLASEPGKVWPLWLSESRILFVQSVNQQGTLVEFSLDDKTTRSLASDVDPGRAPSLSPDGKRVAVVASRLPKSELGSEQVAAVELDTGKLTWLTDESFGVAAPSYSPDGKRLAYLMPLLSESEHDQMLKILDLKSGRTEVAWRDEEERMLASADTLERAGEPAQAMAMLEDLLARYPKTRMLTAVRFRMMLLNLKPPLEDLDQAWALWKKFETVEIPEQIGKNFWRPEDRVASDPAEDWIETWGTAASKKAWGDQATDLPRDLRALWLRAGKEKIYLRVDTGDKAGADPSGVGLVDTVILIKDADAPDTTHTRIGTQAAWEHTAARTVIVRHWFEGGEASQYDVEIRGAQGETIHRFLASGFAPPSDPVFDRVAIAAGETPGAIYGISRKALGLEGKHKAAIQVVTMKGGIDPRARLERQGGEGGVADAFGPENAPDRLKAGGAGPCVVKGYAAQVEVE